MSEADAPQPMPVTARNACVIGAGLGGLALAIRLQAAGVDTVLVEARDKVGGCVAGTGKDGFSFDNGPTGISDRSAFQALWADAGQELANDIEFLPISPACRFHWPDGTHFDLTGDAVALRNEIARIEPADIGGVADFLALCERGEQPDNHVERPPRRDFRQLAELTKSLAGEGQWRSACKLVARHVESPRLQQALTAHLIMTGINPARPASSRLLVADAGQWHDLWHPRGGVHKLAEAMATLFQRLGGTLKLHDPVVKLHLVGNRITDVETQSGWRERFDAVANNGDVMHFYRDLLSGTPRGEQMTARIARQSHSPAMFVVQFALEGGWPGIPHRMVLFADRYEELLQDVFVHGVLPQDFMIFLTHPSVTDATIAPDGRSTFQAAVPVAHMGKLTVDWDQIGRLLEKRILDEIGRRLVPDIHDRILTKCHRSPRDHALDLNAYLGSAFGLEPLMTQSGWLRPHLRDDKLANAYLVGAGTFPGPGVGNSLTSARLAAELMIKDLGA